MNANDAKAGVFLTAFNSLKADEQQAVVAQLYAEERFRKQLTNVFASEWKQNCETAKPRFCWRNIWPGLAAGLVTLILIQIAVRLVRF